MTKKSIPKNKKKKTKPKGRKHGETKIFLLNILLQTAEGLDIDDIRSHLWKELKIKSPKAAYPLLNSLRNEEGLIEYNPKTNCWHIPKQNRIQYLIRADNKLNWFNSKYAHSILDTLPFNDRIKLMNERMSIHKEISESRYQEKLKSFSSDKRLEIESANLSRGALSLILNLHSMDGNLLEILIEKLKSAENMDAVREEIERIEDMRRKDKNTYMGMLSENIAEIGKQLDKLSKRSFAWKHLIQINNFVVKVFDNEGFMLEEKGVI